MLILTRTFHSSVVVWQKPEHALYPQVDWAKVGAGHYAVVDPFDSHALLYLSERTYQVQVRVCLSQDSSLVVLARPGDREIPIPTSPASSSDPSQKSPIPDLTKNSKIWKRFLSWHLSALRRFVPKRDGRKNAPSNKQSQVQHIDRKTTGDDADSSSNVALSAAVLRTLIPYWGLDLNFRLGGDLQPSRALVSGLREMAEKMVRILETRGAQALILYLKAALFLLNRSLAGNPERNPWLLGTPVSLSRGGIPRLIPLVLRQGIGRKDPVAIRMVNSILNSYKAFEGDHELQDLQSIVGPHPTLDPTMLAEFQTFCKEVFWPKVVKSYCNKSQWESITEYNFCISDGDPTYIPLHAGPNHPIGLLGAHLDAWAWLRETEEGLPIPIQWMRHMEDTRSEALFWEVKNRLIAFDRWGNKNTPTNPVNGESKEAFPKSEAFEKGERSLSPLDFLLPLAKRSGGPCIGKLCLLPEPAGKVRTIAIVDYWTQRLMSPVHSWMMAVLKLLPTDGTFNQEEALISFSRRTQLTGDPIYSIDLKSATDLIPLELYKVLMEGIWDERTTALWIKLLTDRNFRVPSGKAGNLVKPELRGSSVRYGRGQPMGTLSSWPSMALVHHALTLFSAWKAGSDPVTFTDYRVLGDDNVTAGSKIAEQYVECARALCVPTSEAKTLSGRLFIFASQIYLDGVNLSPLSLKEELGIKSYNQRMEMALRAMRRGWLDSGCSLSRFLRLLLTQRDYRAEVKKWSSGVLGKISQSALVSAFGIAKRSLLDLLGFQGSGFQPFSLAIANKVEVLSRDKCEAGSNKVRDKNLLSIERAFATACARFLYEDIGRTLAALEVSRLRFHTCCELYRDGSLITSDWIRTTAKGTNGIIHTVGIPLVPEKRESIPKFVERLVKRGFVLPNRQEAKTAYLSEPVFASGNYPTGLELSIVEKSLQWTVIQDAYSSLLGLPESADVESEEDGYGGMGMSIDTPGGRVHPQGRTAKYPSVLALTLDLRREAKALLDQLVTGSSEEVGDPWSLLSELAMTLARVNRIPTFIGLDSINEVIPLDHSKIERSVLRQMRALTSLVAVLPFGVDISSPIEEDIPLKPLEIEEAYEDLTTLGAELTAKTNQGLLTGFPTASFVENNVGVH